MLDAVAAQQPEPQAKAQQAAAQRRVEHCPPGLAAGYQHTAPQIMLLHVRPQQQLRCSDHRCPGSQGQRVQRAKAFGEHRAGGKRQGCQRHQQHARQAANGCRVEQQHQHTGKGQRDACHDLELEHFAQGHAGQDQGKGCRQLVDDRRGRSVYSGDTAIQQAEMQRARHRCDQGHRAQVFTSATTQQWQQRHGHDRVTHRDHQDRWQFRAADFHGADLRAPEESDQQGQH
ncbi:hypothetical protein RYH72_006089 (plasmid) [Pseudomonas syringae pv. actinidiae]